MALQFNTDEAFRFHHLDQTNVPGRGEGGGLWGGVGVAVWISTLTALQHRADGLCTANCASHTSPEPNLSCYKKTFI